FHYTGYFKRLIVILYRKFLTADVCGSEVFFRNRFCQDDRLGFNKCGFRIALKQREGKNLEKISVYKNQFHFVERLAINKEQGFPAPYQARGFFDLRKFSLKSRCRRRHHIGLFDLPTGYGSAESDTYDAICLFVEAIIAPFIKNE